MRVKRRKDNKRWIAVSGGFDPLHIGHVRLMRAARALGDRLVVILNNDNWLRAKKGFVFMPEKERAELIRSFSFVDKVIITDHKKGDRDRTVSRALTRLRPTIFANGGDRTKTSTPEKELCKNLGITCVYNVGRGGKIQSSSRMVNSAMWSVLRSKR